MLALQGLPITYQSLGMPTTNLNDARAQRLRESIMLAFVAITHRRAGIILDPDSDRFRALQTAHPQTAELLQQVYGDMPFW